MDILVALVIGITVGLFIGALVAYKYADFLVAKAVAEYKKAEEIEQKLQSLAGNIIGEARKGL